MLFSRLLILSTWACSATAYTLPADLADGLYKVSIDSRGNEVHRRFDGNGTVTIPAAKRALEARAPSEPQELDSRQDLNVAEFRCGCGYVSVPATWYTYRA